MSAPNDPDARAGGDASARAGRSSAAPAAASADDTASASRPAFSAADWGDADVGCDAAAAPQPSPTTATPFAIPEAERYAVAAVVGSGGMGRVVVAHDRRVGRNVALKEPHDAVAAAHISAEAAIAGRLEHPAIVPVYDAGVGRDGLPFYTMRFVRGRDLGAAIAAADDPAARLALVRPFLQACEAIAYAHSVGVVHRDLKPANIVVGRFGETQVVDWGLAVAIDADGAAAAPGPVAGTPAYMAPEVAAGGVADSRADVYALGMTLAELLSGAAPGAGATPAELLAGLRGGLVPLPALVGAPDELVAILRRATAAAPQDRYVDAAALAADVAAWLDGRRVSAFAYSPLDVLRRFVATFRVALGVAVAALVALLIIGVVAARGVVRERDRAAAAEGSALAALARAAADDGRGAEAEVLAAAALCRASSASARGVLSAAADVAVAERADAAGPAIVAVDAAARWLVRSDGRETTLAPTGGGEALWRYARAAQLASVADCGDVALLLDGRDAVVLDPRGGVLLAPTYVGPVRDLELVAGELVMPIGDALRVLGGPVPRDDRVVACADGVEHLAIASRPDGAAALPVAASPTVAVSCGDGAVAVGALRRAGWQRWPGPPEAEYQGGRALAWSGDGRRLAIGNVRGWVRVVDIDGREVARLRAGVGAVVDVALDGAGAMVLVSGEQPGARLLDVASGLLRMRVPSASRAALRWLAPAPDGALRWLTTDTRAVRWQLPAVAHPHRVPVAPEAGLSALALLGTARALAATGQGALLSVDLARAEVVARRAVGARPVKGVAVRDSAGVVEAVATGLGAGVVAFALDASDGVLGAGRALLRHDLRRIVALDDGRVVGVSWGTSLFVLAGDGVHAYADVLSAPARDLVSLAGGAFAVIDDASGDVLRFTLQPTPATKPTREVLVAGAGGLALAVAADGSEVVVARDDALVVHRDGAVRRLVVPGHRFIAVARSDDGALLAGGTIGGEVFAFCAAGDAPCARLRGHSARVPALAFAADGARLVSASWDGDLRVWRTAPWRADADTLYDASAARWALDDAQALELLR